MLLFLVVVDVVVVVGFDDVADAVVVVVHGEDEGMQTLRSHYAPT